MRRLRALQRDITAFVRRIHVHYRNPPGLPAQCVQIGRQRLAAGARFAQIRHADALLDAMLGQRRQIGGVTQQIGGLLPLDPAHLGLDVAGHRQRRCRAGADDALGRGTPVVTFVFADALPDRRQFCTQIAAVPDMFAQREGFPEQAVECGTQYADRRARRPRGMHQAGTAMLHRRRTADQIGMVILQMAPGQQRKTVKRFPGQCSLWRPEWREALTVIRNGVDGVREFYLQLSQLQRLQLLRRQPLRALHLEQQRQHLGRGRIRHRRPVHAGQPAFDPPIQGC